MGDDADSRMDERGLGRLMALSDGIFAFSMTLLAVDLRVPARTTNIDLGSQLLAMESHYITFAISFLVIGMYWAAHRRIFRHLVRMDDRLTHINLLLMLTIAFLPFPTRLVGEYGDSSVATVFYAASVTVSGLLMSLLWLYATHKNRLVSPDMDPLLRRRATVRGLAVPATFGLSIAVAIVQPGIARYIWLSLGFVSLSLDLVFTRWFHPRAEAEDR